MLFNLLFVKYHLMLGRHICLTLSLLAYLVFLVPILCKVLIVHRLNYPGCRILFMRGFRFWSSFYGDLRFTASAFGRFMAGYLWTTGSWFHASSLPFSRLYLNNLHQKEGAQVIVTFAFVCRLFESVARSCMQQKQAPSRDSAEN